MLIRSRRGWELPESAATPEAVFLNRRAFIKSAAVGSILAAAPIAGLSGAARAASDDASASLYPAPRDERFTLDRPITDEKIATTYNNFYEFGSHKQISKAAQALVIRPWEIAVDGLVEKEFTIGIDDLLKKMPLDERLYRHRCVEAWSIAIPYSGFPLKALVDFCKPTNDAKFLRMETFQDPDMASGQKQFWYPWPYVEGLTMAEATNELAYIATGLYGKPIPKQNGAPLRLAVPWKYGFKHIKSIVRFTFTDKRPVSYWERLGPSEYGFWANVNPEVDHPRWSQARERALGWQDGVPTQLFNGYSKWVAALYTGPEFKSEVLYR